MKNIQYLLLLVLVAGCTVKKEYILTDDGLPTDEAQQIIVEGPGGDMVGITVEVLEKLAPLLPEPWNSILIALIAGFSAATASWVFRSPKRKKAEEAKDGVKTNG